MDVVFQVEQKNGSWAVVEKIMTSVNCGTCELQQKYTVRDSIATEGEACRIKNAKACEYIKNMLMPSCSKFVNDTMNHLGFLPYYDIMMSLKSLHGMIIWATRYIDIYKSNELKICGLEEPQEMCKFQIVESEGKYVVVPICKSTYKNEDFSILTNAIARLNYLECEVLMNRFNSIIRSIIAVINGFGLLTLSEIKEDFNKISNFIEDSYCYCFDCDCYAKNEIPKLYKNNNKNTIL